MKKNYEGTWIQLDWIDRTQQIITLMEFPKYFPQASQCPLGRYISKIVSNLGVLTYFAVMQAFDNFLIAFGYLAGTAVRKRIVYAAVSIFVYDFICTDLILPVAPFPN
jgi:hypothetical protein